jgi:phosphate starvation-inducible PhoH-like protein
LYDATESTEPLTPDGVHLAIQELRANELDTDSQNEVGNREEAGEAESLLLLKTPKRQIKPRSNRQRDYIRKILTHDISFGIGPAGTGKTYLAVACAVSALMNQEVQRIVLVRPAVEAGERLGFLPGDLGEKIDPYLRPLYDALHDMLGPEKVNRLLERNTIELAPLAYMRGRTLNDSFIILDEAQNTTAEQMKMFLTRIGFGTTAVITGDVTQVDLPVKQNSGLKQVMEILDGVEGIAFTHFDKKDVVRHRLVQKIVEAYEAHDRSKTGRVVGSA